MRKTIQAIAFIALAAIGLNSCNQAGGTVGNNTNYSQNKDSGKENGIQKGQGNNAKPSTTTKAS